MTLTKGQQNVLLAIMQNSRFIVEVAGSTKMARAYYNDFKFWCKKLNYKHINGFENKGLTLVLHRNYKCGDTPVHGSNLNRILTYGPKNDEESVFYYYYKNHNFFSRILSALLWAFKSYNEGRYYCKVVKLPTDFDWNGAYGLTDSEMNFTIDARDMMGLYGFRWLCTAPYGITKTIQSERLKKTFTWKLPAPKNTSVVPLNKCDRNREIPDGIGTYNYRTFVC